MKNIATFYLLLLLSVNHCFAQVANKAPATLVPTSAVALQPHVVKEGAALMSELDYYKKLAEQSKADADRAHDDIWSAYGINASIMLAVSLLVLGAQYINVRAQVKKLKEDFETSINRVNAALTESTNELNILKSQEQANRQEIELTNERVKSTTSLVVGMQSDNSIISQFSLPVLTDYFESIKDYHEVNHALVTVLYSKINDVSELDDSSYQRLIKIANAIAEANPNYAIERQLPWLVNSKRRT
jgi:cell division protein FtsL